MYKVVISILTLMVLLWGCASVPQGTSGSLVVRIFPTEGNQTSGVVVFTRVDSGVRITGTLSGLPPGKHGFHIHEFGDLSTTDGKSTGGHFSLTGQPHGAPVDKMRHIGDLGNIVADENGVAVIDFIDSTISFYGKNSILGRGVIVHAQADDLVSQPTGDAGGRIGYGVIGLGRE